MVMQREDVKVQRPYLRNLFKSDIIMALILFFLWVNFSIDNFTLAYILMTHHVLSSFSYLYQPTFSHPYHSLS